MIIATKPTKEHETLNIEICDLFEIWCLRFGIFNTLVSFSIKVAIFQAGGWAEIYLNYH